MCVPSLVTTMVGSCFTTLAVLWFTTLAGPLELRLPTWKLLPPLQCVPLACLPSAFPERGSVLFPVPAVLISLRAFP